MSKIIKNIPTFKLLKNSCNKIMIQKISKNKNINKYIYFDFDDIIYISLNK